MAQGDMYRLMVKSTLLNQETLSVFHYEHTTGTGTSADLREAFNTILFPTILDIQNDALVSYEVNTINYNDVGDFEAFPVNAPGRRVGNTMPPYAAWGFVLNRSSRTLRNGAKRFAGVSEEDVVDGVATAGVLPVLTICANTLGNIISFGSNDFTPQIVRLDPITGLPIANIPVANASYRRVTTQNTRKFGR